MKQYYVALMLCSFFIITGCNNEDVFNTPMEDKELKTDFSRDIVDVMGIANKAINIVEKASTRSNTAKRVIDPTAIHCVTSPNTRNSEISDTLLYIVNYADDKGFAIISGDKRAEGLLGVVEQGNYDGSTNTYAENLGFTTFMDKAKSYVASVSGGPVINDKPEWIVLSKTEYDTIYSNKIDPLVGVRWGQTGIEGKYAPNGVAGCSNIAMGQIMSYFHYPYNISITYPGASVNSLYLNWTAINSHEVVHFYQGCQATETAHESISQLIRQLGYLNESVYKSEPKATSTYDSKVRISFANLGYTVSPNLISYNNESLENTLKDGKLLYMRGSHISETDTVGHAWVVDGVCKYTIRATTWEKALNELTWKYVSEYSYSSEYLHYNWGWDGNCNGYFLLSIFSPGRGKYYDNEEQYSNSSIYNFENEVYYFTVTR